MEKYMQPASSGIHALQRQALQPLAASAKEPGVLPWPGTSRDTAHMHSLRKPTSQHQDSQHQAIQLSAGQVLQSEQHIWQGILGRMVSQASQAGPWAYSQTSQPALMQIPTPGHRAWQEAMRSVAPSSAPTMPQHQSLQPLGAFGQSAAAVRAASAEASGHSSQRLAPVTAAQHKHHLAAAAITKAGCKWHLHGRNVQWRP